MRSRTNLNKRGNKRATNARNMPKERACLTSTSKFIIASSIFLVLCVVVIGWEPRSLFASVKEASSEVLELK